MFTYYKHNDEIVKKKLLRGEIDNITISTTNLIDEIILSMNKMGVLNYLDSIDSRRGNNTSMPFHLIMALAITAKMKIRTSLSDIPYAIQDHRTLASIGYNFIGNNDLMTEDAIRHIVVKNNYQEWTNYYNQSVKNIMTYLNFKPSIHILDCTKIIVNFNNENYEMASVINDDGKYIRGYKLATLRGIVNDVGMIEEIKFGSMNVHDLHLSEDMIKKSTCFKRGDVLINDRGFISRNLINYMKNVRGVDTYVPVRKNMELYDMAVDIADSEGNWCVHPNPKRHGQMITFVSNLGSYWRSGNDDVDLNACVVWDEKSQSHSVFITTDLSKTARQIIRMYELRPEIEEDYRQLKDFWKLEDFRSTKVNVVMFHIICVLLEYLFFQIYISTDGTGYLGKSLPVAFKSYKSSTLPYYIIFSGMYFGIFKMKEMFEIYAECDTKIRNAISEFL